MSREPAVKTVLIVEDNVDAADSLAMLIELRGHKALIAHDAETGGDIFGAVGGENRDPIAARKAALLERARDGVRHRIELRVTEFAGTSFAPEIDDRRLVEIAVAANEIAEIGEQRHRLVNSSARVAAR